MRMSESRRPTPGMPLGSNKLFFVGSSLYPLDSEAQGSADWYGRDLAEDLEILHDARCALVRVFVSWRKMEPQVGCYDESAMNRLADIVSQVHARKMRALVCFFADDCHAELSEVVWGRPRDPRTDSYLLQREIALVGEVVGRLKTEKGVFGWQLGNEAFLSGFTTTADLRAWTESMRDAILEQDPTRPIALGADAETLSHATGADARPAIEICDFAVSHVTSAYRAYAAEGPITSGPSTYLEAFLLHLARGDSPVLLDETGPLTLENSHAEEAAALRLSLWSALCNRASGILLRRLRDMETERREPYFIEPFEALVGVIDASGERKPSFREVTRFIDTAARIELEKHPPVAERAAILLPAERYDPLPSLAGLYGPRACFHSFISAKRAQVPVTVVREGDDTTDLSLLVVPSAFSLSEEMWKHLTAFVQGGGTLVVSYGGGDAHPAVRELFGVEFLGDAGPRRSLSCRVAQHDLLGEVKDFDSSFELQSYALISAKTASVVATDESGSPLLTVNQLGQGRAIYIAAPVERAIAQNDPWATPPPVLHLLREVYGAAARAAGVSLSVSCDAPEVELTLMQGDLDDVLVLVNHAGRRVQAGLRTDRRVATIEDVRGGEAVPVGGSSFAVPLGPNGVATLRVMYA